MRRTSKVTAALLATATCTSAGVMALAGVATAAPTNAPNITTGTADCGPAGMFTFVVTENQGSGTAWNVAFVTSTTGDVRALFHPKSFDLTFTSPQGTFMENVSKATAPGPISCQISSTPAPGVSLSGTVTGTMTFLG